MNVNDDSIEIPIEFSTKDKRELDETLKKLEKLDITTKKAKDTTSKQPFTPQTQQSITGTIFDNRITGGIPLRDKTSNQAIQKDNEFKKVKKELSSIKKAQKEVDDKMKNLSSIISLIPLGGNSGGIMGFASKFAPFLAPALVAVGFGKMIMDELLRDGGFLDRRLKILIEKQYFKLTKRKEQSEINRGFKTLRVTSSPALRGPTSQIFNSQQLIKRGILLTDETQESISKGVLP